ncbi:methyl-accepting chemotaxis protein [Kurthia massiliensis]|uniref:methyl-accepting chemotaxis protein n=1 Tax=Kurthia massiliensis TaxID=1033739 RepID=UPI00028945A7|nr:methyl-accepting chemotaxis protein [Kurthia massiliensis]
MRVGQKLNIGFYAIIGLMCISVIITFTSLVNIDQKSDEALKSRVKQVQIVDKIRSDMYRQEVYARAVIMNDSQENREKLANATKAVDDGITTLETYLMSKAMTEKWEMMNADNNVFNEQVDLFLQAVDNNDLKKATKIVNEDLAATNKKLEVVAGEFLDYQNDKLNDISAATDRAISMTKLISIIALVISLIIGFIVIFLVKRMVTKPLEKVTNAVKVVANGDLSQPHIDYQSKDEIGQLTVGMNQMKDSLRTLIQNIQQNAEQLSASAEELSASTQEVTATNENITSQVTNTSEITTGSSTAARESANAMNETAQGVQRIASAVQTLNDASENASHLSMNGVDIVTKARTQMSTIHESTGLVNDLVAKLSAQTKEIEHITNVITDITDQTNLLALNASIEAARAGEHGKGFAVVAQEVSNLAEESRKSANLIASLTKDIQADTQNVEKAVAQSLHSVTDGVNIIVKAGDSFSDISTAVDVMTSQIQEVSATAEQLSAGAEEVSASVHEISTGSEQAATSIDVIVNAMSEQMVTMGQVSHVAHDLSVNAQKLQEEVARFNV